MKEAKRCPHCDATMVEYPHTMSRGMARILYRITEHMEPETRRFHVSDCQLTNTQINNLQKLRYWDLIEKAADESRKGGWWILTDKGLKFAQGKFPAYKKVWTYRGERTRYEGDQVFIDSLTDGWKYRPQYAQESLPFFPVYRDPLKDNPQSGMYDPGDPDHGR